MSPADTLVAFTPLSERCLALLFHVEATTWTALPVNPGQIEKTATLATADFGTRQSVPARLRRIDAHEHGRALRG